MSDREAVEHAYVHVPFCATICPFCNFHVVQRRSGAVEAYLDRLDREAAAAVERVGGVDLRTLYVGGGTPSHLREAELGRLWAILERRLGRPSEEATLEVHPSNVVPGRPGRWRDLGFTRLSVGVESTDDAVLTALGRHHDGASALAALEQCLASQRPGSDATSADVMTAIDGQDVGRDLEVVAATGVAHVSCYVLTIEEGTPFDRDGVEVDPDAEWEALLAADEVLLAAGLARYEVSNHARPGAECRHNLAYWDNRCWLGLGPGASAHEPAPPGSNAVTIRSVNPPLDDWLAGAPPEIEPRIPQGFAVDAMVAGLRRLDGVDLDDVGRRAGLDAAALFDEAIGSTTSSGLVELDGPRLRATAKGLRYLDQVAGSFVELEAGAR